MGPPSRDILTCWDLPCRQSSYSRHQRLLAPSRPVERNAFPAVNSLSALLPLPPLRDSQHLGHIVRQTPVGLRIRTYTQCSTR
ncbi:hypothetical protein [Microbulbifer halophilus]|uniref:hypothetical protein n=1 Tax=Microbulbifer halophilus TaxID=453963 RepID=UPI003619AC2D